MPNMLCSIVVLLSLSVASRFVNRMICIVHKDIDINKCVDLKKIHGQGRVVQSWLYQPRPRVSAKFEFTL